MTRTDSELWVEILAGNARSWAELVRRYQSLVYAVCTRSGLSLADAGDCFQQTWMLLYQNRRKLHDPSRLSAWLVTTAKREALRLRRLAEKSAVELNGSIVDNPAQISGHSSALTSPDPLPDEKLEELERQAQLEIALRELDTRCQKVLEEFFFAPEEKTYREIARSLGVAANTLGPLRRRCLERLKRIMVKNWGPGERKDD